MFTLISCLTHCYYPAGPPTAALYIEGQHSDPGPSLRQLLQVGQTLQSVLVSPRQPPVHVAALGPAQLYAQGVHANANKACVIKKPINSRFSKTCDNMCKYWFENGMPNQENLTLTHHFCPSQETLQDHCYNTCPIQTYINTLNTTIIIFTITS